MSFARRGSSAAAVAYSSSSVSISGRRVEKLRVDERRRQMADGHGAGASLGLRRFAGIVDDERIDQRRRPKHGFRRAGLREHHGFAGQPFQRAMRAEMNQRVDVSHVTQPEIEGDIGVARRPAGCRDRSRNARRARRGPAAARRRACRLSMQEKRKAPSMTAGSSCGAPQASLTLVDEFGGERRK